MSKIALRAGFVVLLLAGIGSAAANSGPAAGLYPMKPGAPPKDSLGFYDNGIWGIAETLGTVGGDSTPYWGVAFDQGTCVVESVAAFLAGDYGHNDAVYFQIWDDASGQPGNPLWTSNMVFINDSNRRWYQTKPTEPVPVNGRFYVACYPYVNSASHVRQHWDNNGRQSPPNAQWENDGNWIPDTTSGDLMIRCYADIHDVACVGIVVPSGVLDSGAYVRPACSVKNRGDYVESYIVRMHIGTFYYDSANVWYQGPGNVQTVNFPPCYINLPAGGPYPVSCSACMAGDADPRDDRFVSSFYVAGWMRRADLPIGSRHKRVKDGGCLAYLPDSGMICALKGNHTCEFYAYNPATNVWAALDSVPLIGRDGVRRSVKGGAALTATGSEAFALKGGAHNEFWHYNENGMGQWGELNGVPAGIRPVGPGAGLAAIRAGDTTYVYALKGSGTNEFYRYNSLRAWSARASAPAGATNRGWRDGSCIAAYGDTVVYALKGRSGEFFRYDVEGDSWSARARLLKRSQHTSRTGKRIGSGASLASLNGRVYAMRGGRTLDVWSYNPLQDSWTQVAFMPIGGGRRYGAGGALVAASGLLYALKGNNTLEFYSFAPASTDESADGNSLNRPSARASGGLDLLISPNPLVGATTIRFTLPRPDRVRIELYDVAGKLVSAQSEGAQQAGSHYLRLSTGARRLARGVYLLRLTTSECSETAKLVVE